MMTQPPTDTQKATEALGLYVSVPFCRSKCSFCNFASGVYPASHHGRYVDRLTEELGEARRQAGEIGATLPERVDSIYLGGGTPSVLAPEMLRQLFAAIRDEFELSADAEITMECAPGQIEDDVLTAMAECGVNRASLGVQSFVDREAAASGRLHNRAVVLRDIERLRAAGINRLNIDLIAGLPHQTAASWKESLAVLAGTEVEHASVYMLEVDDDSRLGKEMLAGGTRYHSGAVPKDDAIAAMFERAVEAFSVAGLLQYELSNFAFPGRESKHNLKYWERAPYLGIGVDAHSMLNTADGGAVRFGYGDSLDVFLTEREEWQPEKLSMQAQVEEAWFLGLRLQRGVEMARMRREFGEESIGPFVEALRGLGDLVEVDREFVRLTPRGRLLSNEVFQVILETGEESFCQPA